MKIIRSVPIVEVEAEFLRAEWYKPVYDKFRAQYEEVVKAKDYDNEEHNRIRKELLLLDRSWILQRLPSDVTWFEASVSPTDFEEILIIHEPSWVKTFGNLKKLKDVAASIKKPINDDDPHIKLIKEIKTGLENQPFPEKIITVSRYKNSPLTIFEGNHRGVAFQLKANETNNHIFIPQQIIIGFSENMHFWPWLNGYSNI